MCNLLYTSLRSASTDRTQIQCVTTVLLGGGLENRRHWAQQASGQFAGNRGRIKGEKRAHPARLAAGLADDARAHPSRQRLRLQSRALPASSPARQARPVSPCSEEIQLRFPVRLPCAAPCSCRDSYLSAAL